MNRAQLRLSPFVYVFLVFFAGCGRSPQQALEQRLEYLHGLSEGAGLQESMLGDVPSATYEEVLRQWEEAQEGYSDVLRSSPDRKDVQERLRIVQRRIELLEAEQAYAARIEVRNLAMGPGTTRRFREPAQGIYGEVKNLGELTVTRLVLEFELLDDAARAVADHEWTPVSETASEGVLKPNYSRPFGFAVEQPPSDWVGVRASVRLVRVSREGAELPEEKARR